MSKYDSIVTTTKVTSNITTLSVTKLAGSLEAYEKRLCMCGNESMESSFPSNSIYNSRILEMRSNFRENFRRNGNSRNSDHILHVASVRN